MEIIKPHIVVRDIHKELNFSKLVVTSSIRCIESIRILASSTSYEVLLIRKFEKKKIHISKGVG
mgnify:CR=1 FL=1